MKLKRRKPWLAVLLGFLSVPVGYAYAGFAKRGLFLALLILLLIPATVILIKVRFGVALLFSFVAACLVFSLLILFDVYRLTKKQPVDYGLKFYNTWWAYILLYVAYNLVCFPVLQGLTKTYLVEAYKIPAGSMIPTLEIGDHVLVDKTRSDTDEMHRGDLIVFRPPKNPATEYLKRVEGLPGDSVEIKDKVLYLNNVPQEKQYVVHVDAKMFAADASPRDNFGPVIVPEGAVFVLGDNRDNSFDSRFFGFVPIDSVSGKVVNIYWSWDRENFSVRWERIGRYLEQRY